MSKQEIISLVFTCIAWATASCIAGVRVMAAIWLIMIAYRIEQVVREANHE